MDTGDSGSCGSFPVIQTGAVRAVSGVPLLIFACRKVKIFVYKDTGAV